MSQFLTQTSQLEIDISILIIQWVYVKTDTHNNCFSVTRAYYHKTSIIDFPWVKGVLFQFQRQTVIQYVKAKIGKAKLT